jgi:actin-like ATPase involved in cell morphogenesis
VGVDLGSSTTTVSTRRSDLRAESGPAESGTARFEAARADGATAADLPVDEPALVVLAVPATWSSTRRRAHLEAAANAGFDASFLVSEPEAAARQYLEDQGREADSDALLVVCNIGAGSCNVGVVRREGDHYSIEAATSADDIGGREFDRLLLEHLASRHRQADPEFWARAGDPAETALRAEVLDEVRRAREHLTDHPAVTVSLPGLARDLRLTREDVDQCLMPAILRTVGLIEDAMRDAAVEVDRVEGLLLVGGVSRMPLAATVLGHHLGVEPVRPHLPDLVVAEGAALAGLARIRSAAGEPPEVVSRFAKLHTSPDVLVTAMVVVLLVAAVVGAVLLNRGDDTVLDGDVVLQSSPAIIDETAAVETESAAPTEAEDSGVPVASEDPESEEDEMTASAASSSTPSVPVSDAALSPTPYGPPASEQEPETTAEVPDVVGETVADAKRMLAAAGFTNVAVQGDRRDSEGPGYSSCEVTGQSPGGGSQSDRDALISVEYVYVGTDSC